jgi:RNA polymerase sigma factor (sigma-70 family)
MRTDQDLVSSTLAGDRTAFNQLMARYQAIAMRMAVRLVANQGIAEDILQEAWLQAYLSLGNLKEYSRFRGWLIGIVINLCKNFLRKEMQERRFQVSLESDWFQGEQIADTFGHNPLDIALERELHARVLAIVEELSPSYRHTVYLYYYDSLSVAEISAITGASIEAVKVRLYRARIQIRNQVSLELEDLLPRRVLQEKRLKMIEVTILDIVREGEDWLGNYIVLLKEKGGQRVLPIWIGPFEASTIASGLRAFPTPRPLTFNFIASLLDTLGASLVEARIEKLSEEIFYGVAKLSSDQGAKEVDARPSDLLSLAVRTGCPIFVAEEVMEKAAKLLPEIENLTRDIPLPLGENMDFYLKEFFEQQDKPCEAE